MVTDYLKKMRKDLLREKLELESDLDSLNVRFQENLKLLQHLKTEVAEYYDAFSPRVQNQDLNDSIKILEDENQEIMRQSEEKKKQIFTWNSKLKEVELVLKKSRLQDAELTNERHNLTELNILEAREEERQKIAKKLYEMYISILTISHKGEFCSHLIDMDPGRCKIEFSSLFDMFQTVGSDLDQLIHELQPLPETIGFEQMILPEIEKMKQQDFIVDYEVHGEAYALRSICMVTFYRVFEHILSFLYQQGGDLSLRIEVDYQDEVFVFLLDGNWQEDLIDLSGVQDLIHAISGQLQTEKKEHFNRVYIEVPVESEE